VIRLLLAVAVTVALLAVVLPAVEDARAYRTATAIDADAERLSRAVDSLAYGDDPTPSTETAPRRIVRFSVPPRSWTAADVRYVAVGGRPGTAGSRPVVAYAFSGGRETERRLPLPVPILTPGGPVVLREPGSHALSVSLVARGDGPVVVVRRT
jgi:hypothetical protein